MKKKVLVTGGTGYIGSHTVVELILKGYEVIIADNLSNSFEWIVDRIETITHVKPIFHQVELTNQNEVENLFAQYPDISGVIHFAALKAVGESVSKPLHYYHNNILSLLNLLKTMEKHSVSNFVFSSSCTVYGQPTQLPVTENSPILLANSPYGYTKQVSEQIIQDQTKCTSLKAILLRYFNPIGAHESAQIGELPIGIPNNLIPFVTQTAIQKREILNVFGNDYSTPDGTCIRDYIHVVDLAKAHISALERLEKTDPSQKIEIFNIGTGNGFSVLDVIKSFESVSGMKLNYRFAPRREGDIEQIWADTHYANQVLGWKAEKTLDDMLSSAWKWELKLKEL
jgi:UDP-glucose 4-epimerase